MSVFWTLTQKTAALGFILFFLLVGLLFYQTRAQTILDTLTTQLDDLKTALLETKEETPRLRPEVDARWATLIQGERLERVLLAYGDDAPPRSAWTTLSVASLRTLETFLHATAREQRAATEELALLLVALVAALALLIVWSEFQNQRSLWAANYRRELNERLLEAVENERSLLAFDLHDSVAQKLGHIKQQMERSRHITEVKALLPLVSDAVEEIRQLYQGLREPEGDERSLSERLHQLFGQVSLLSTIRLQSSVFGLDDSPLPRSSAHHIFHMVQEILWNGLKHSGATLMQIHVYVVPPHLRIVYSDNGSGLDPTGVGGRLRSLEFRAKLLDATLRARPGDQGGTTLQIEVPHVLRPAGG